MTETSIEWTDKTWNPVRGCTKISPGCKHCYAEAFAERFRGVPGHPYEQGFDLRLVPEALTLPFGEAKGASAWRQPSLVFVNSMSDLLHADVPEPYIARVLDVMLRADWHVYQLLTKRADRLENVWPRVLGRTSLADVPEHIWVGVSVEDRRFGIPRIENLRATPAAVRFLSVEPLLEDLGQLDLRWIDWVIVGGESGPGARPMRPEWVRSIRDQCQAAGVRFFFKQWGGLRKKLAGRELDGRTWDEMPPLVRRPYPGRQVAARRLETMPW